MLNFAKSSAYVLIKVKFPIHSNHILQFGSSANIILFLRISEIIRIKKAVTG